MPEVQRVVVRSSARSRGSTLRTWQHRSGLRLPEVRPLLLVLLGDRDHLGPDQLETVALNEPLARRVRLGEEETACRARPRGCRARARSPCARAPTTASATSRSGRACSPKRSYAQRSDSSAVIASTSGSCSRLTLATEEHLLQRVAAQPEAERLERDDLVGRDVAEVDVGPEVLDEPRLRRLRRRLPDRGRGSRSSARSRRRGPCASRPIGRKMPAVPPSRASVITFQAPASSSSLIHSTHSYGANTTSESLEPTSESTVKSRAKSCDQLELALARDLDRAVGDLDMLEVEARAATRLYSSSLLARVDGLEERAAADDGRVSAVERRSSSARLSVT